jgi:hypothetical protein
MSKIITVNYLNSIHFTVETDKTFPVFNNSESTCDLRNRFVQMAMQEINVYSPYHPYSDYVVEEVFIDGNENESWYLGS